MWAMGKSSPPWRDRKGGSLFSPPDSWTGSAGGGGGKPACRKKSREERRKAGKQERRNAGMQECRNPKKMQGLKEQSLTASLGVEGETQGRGRREGSLRCGCILLRRAAA